MANPLVRVYLREGSGVGDGLGELALQQDGRLHSVNDVRQRLEVLVVLESLVLKQCIACGTKINRILSPQLEDPSGPWQ